MEAEDHTNIQEATSRYLKYSMADTLILTSFIGYNGIKVLKDQTVFRRFVLVGAACYIPLIYARNCFVTTQRELAFKYFGEIPDE